MEQNKYGVAIDIGASKVTVLVGEQREGGRIKILAGSSVPLKADVIKRGEIENVNDVTVALRKALQTIENEDNIKVNKAIIGITGQYASCENKQESVYVKFSDEISHYDIDALAENVKRIKPKEGCSVIDIIPLHYSIDGKAPIENPLGASGNRLTGSYNIIYGDNSKLNLLKRAVARAGVEVVDMVPFSLAAGTAVLSEEDMELGVCLVDFGATTIEIAIFQDRRIGFTATLPYGATLLNSDIKSYGILQRSIESLKVQYGSAMPEYTPDDVAIEIPSISSTRPKTIAQRTLSRIIEARLIEIIKGVKEIINNSGYANRISEGIVLTGGGSKLTNVDRLFRKISTYDTRIGIPDSRVDGIDNDIIFDTRYATVIGLLLKGIERGEDMEVQILNVEPEPEVVVVVPPVVVVEEKKVEEPKVEEKKKEEPKPEKKKNSFFGKKEKRVEPSLFAEEEEEDEDEIEEEEVEEEVIEKPKPKKKSGGILDRILDAIVKEEN